MTDYIITVLALAGTVLNIKRKRSCFVIWCGTNAYWCWRDYGAGLEAQAVLFGIYFGMSLWGLWEWEAAKNG